MKKPLFLRVVDVSGKKTFLPLPLQSIPDKGNKMGKIDPTILAIPRTPVSLNIGEVWATEKLTYNSRGWYNIGIDLVRITDKNGQILEVEDTDGNSIESKYIEAFKKYMSGDSKVEDKEESTGVKTFLSTLKYDKRLKPPTIENDGWYVDTDVWYHLVRNYVKKKNTLLIGDSGAGKTDLIRIMMQKIGKPLDIFDMAISNPSKALCGNLRAENGTTYYQYARFAKVIQEEGAVLLDELSRANPMANNILLPVLDKRRTLYIEDAIETTGIKLHDKCCIMATANIGSKFIGTSMLDHALLNRFQQVEINYPPKAKESLLLQKVHGLDKSTADTLASLVDTIRKHKDLSKDISTRQLMEIGELISDGYSIVKAFEFSVLMQFENEKGHGGERQEVLSIISSK